MESRRQPLTVISAAEYTILPPSDHSLSSTVVGRVSLPSRPRHFDLDFASSLLLTLDFPWITNYSGVVDADIVHRGIVELQLEAANDPRDGQVHFCVCHAKVSGR